MIYPPEKLIAYEKYKNSKQSVANKEYLEKAFNITKSILEERFSVVNENSCLINVKCKNVNTKKGHPDTVDSKIVTELDNVAKLNYCGGTLIVGSCP